MSRWLNAQQYNVYAMGVPLSHRKLSVPADRNNPVAQTLDWDKTATPNYKSANNNLTLPSLPRGEIGQENQVNFSKIHTVFGAYGVKIVFEISVI